LTFARLQITPLVMEKLLHDIRAFCAVHSIPATRLGDLALNDTAFVHKLEKGRRVWPETEAKVRDWMVQFERERAA
jgi:hypothetical protein